MAEITAEKSVEWLTSDKAFGQECYSRKQIAALIEQQAAEIEKLKAQLDCGVQEMAETDKEIAKKDRMLKLACNRLAMLSANDEHGYGKKTWLTWLEKEAERVE